MSNLTYRLYVQNQRTCSLTQPRAQTSIDADSTGCYIPGTGTSLVPPHPSTHTQHTQHHTHTAKQPTTKSTPAWLLSLLLFAASRHGASLSPPASRVYRHPMVAVRGIDDLLCQQLRLLKLWRLSTKFIATVPMTT